MRVMFILAPVLVLALLAGVPLPAAAAPPVPVVDLSSGESTNFAISVTARDGKVIGNAMGGARIIVKDRRTGDPLASGVTYGPMEDIPAKPATDTTKAEAERKSARLEFSLELFEPTPVTITAIAPLAQTQSLVSTSRDMLLLPNKDYTEGNGIVLELPGLSVDILRPAASMTMKHDPKKAIVVSANIVNLSGTTLEKDSAGAAPRYEVVAQLYKDGRYITDIPMNPDGDRNSFSAGMKLPVPGTYQLAVTAYDKKTKDAGMDSTTITLTP